MKGAIKSPMARSMRAEEAKWQAEDDVRTLMRAQEIQADRARMARADEGWQEMNLPTTLYKSPGSFTIPGTRDTYRYIGAKTQEELDHYLANGWFETRDAAIAARKASLASPATSNTSFAPSQPSVDEATPPTRAEMEQKAKELGINFTEHTSDAKLSKAILKALGA